MAAPRLSRAARGLARTRESWQAADLRRSEGANATGEARRLLALAEDDPTAAAQQARQAVRDHPASLQVAAAAATCGLADPAQPADDLIAHLLDLPWHRYLAAADAVLRAVEARRSQPMAQRVLDLLVAPPPRTSSTLMLRLAGFAGRSPVAADVLASWDRAGLGWRTDKVRAAVRRLDPVAAVVMLHDAGEFSRAESLAAQVLHDRPGNRTAARVAGQIAGARAVAAAPYADPPAAAGSGSAAAADAGWGEVAATPVLYAVNHALPQNSSGYSTRSQSLLHALSAGPFPGTAVTRPGFAWASESSASDQVASVRYLHLPPPQPTPPAQDVNLSDEIADFTTGLVRAARAAQASVIHAASNHRAGLAAVRAARVLGVPSIYEVRGLWEWTRASADPRYTDTDGFELSLELEVAAARGADRVLTITAALAEELIGRGVPAGKVSVLPNGVNLERFAPKPRDEALAAELGMTGRVGIGYIGSISEYEGLDLLLHAVAALPPRSAAHVLLVGDGPALPGLRRLADELGLADRVAFTGRIPNTEVERYYSLVDIAPLPRKPFRVCEIVSPLKPFEAMAMGKTVVVSSVAALAEVIDDERTGLVFAKGSAPDLAAKLDLLLTSPDLREQLGATGRQWVHDERDWKVLIRRLEAVYAELGVAPRAL